MSILRTIGFAIGIATAPMGRLSAQALTPEPEPPSTDPLNHMHVSGPVLFDHLQVGNVQILLEVTPLRSVVRALGMGALEQGKGNHGDPPRTCLSGVDTEGPWTLWISSDGESGGPNEVVLSFVLVRQGADLSTCPQRGRVALRLPRGIRLGMPVDSLRRLFGPPQAVVGDTLGYGTEHDTTKHGQPVVTQSTFYVIAHDGKVTGLFGYRFTTND
jgi:hypothetical protein